TGTSSAQTLTIQFGVKAPAGTYHVSVENGAQSRCYPASYVISAGEANTDVVKSVTLTMDTTGTWATDNTAGMRVLWCLVAGSNRVGTANAWQGATDIIAGPGQFNFIGTAGNVFELFDVSITKGAAALIPPFIMRPYDQEWNICQRYFRTTTSAIGIAYSATAVRFEIPHPGMRASPTFQAPNPISITDIVTANPVQSSPGGGVASNTPDGGQYDLANFSGLTSLRTYVVAPSSNSIRFDARL